MPGGTGGPGGQGGPGKGVAFGAGGPGGQGGAGADGGRGGNGGSGTFVLGIGGPGGDAGTSGVGAVSTGLPALGGAGGNAGLLGNHGAVGKSGTGATLVQSGANSSMLSVTPAGVWLTNSDGQVVLLHGFNEVYKLAPYEPSASGFSADDAAFLAANGFNVVRLGVIWAGVEPQPGVYDAAYVASIQQTVQLLAAHGIYTIIDMHQDLYSASLGGEGAPEWATKTGGLPNNGFGFPGSYYLNPAETAAWDGFWNNSNAANGIGLEDNYAKAWETVAAAVAGNNSVIGYDIMNEPFPGTSWLPTLLGSPFYANQQLTPMYNQVAAAIRAADPNTALFVEPANPAVSEIPSILGAPVQLGIIDDANVVLAFHDYCAGSATSGICGWLANQQAATANAYGKANNIPVFMDEFGASNLPSDLTAEMNAADRYLMSWSEWAYSGVGDITTSGNTGGESVVYDPALPPTGNNVNTGSLQVLAAAYPQAVSGTPLKLSNANGAFTFSYSTAKADGSGNFAAGTQSSISVPAVAYPNGYTVTVTGGHVVSAADAPTLVIASDTDTGVVQVVVTPAP
jgi:endoglycosylceramidase